MIINIRGTNGSGKSTIVKSLLSAQERAEVPLAPYLTPKGVTRSVVGYRVPEHGLIVVGPYRTPCGGCDAIKTQDLVCDSVRRAATLAPNVIFEGAIVSTIFARYLALSRELGNFVWTYLDTPLEVCIDHLAARNSVPRRWQRRAAPKTYKIVEKLKAIQVTRDKALAASERVIDLPWQLAAEQVRELLE